ncbi:TetR family transcriptional regulator [Saccharopolyspora taberi]|uniref:TetR family transcriptional regulator n=1 Tax=Saccharopolyspora taberi TaxID=60895 RepID=A0ABN3VGQ1_9PSEU
MRVVAREGASGVTHRAVAREAGLPTTATTYHFGGAEELLTAALTTCMDEDAARLRELAASVEDPDRRLRALAGLMAELLAAPGRLMAEFELCLLAARRPEWRASTTRWTDALAEFARRHTGDPVRIRTFVHAYDGILLHALLAEKTPTEADFEASLRELLS